MPAARDLSKEKFGRLQPLYPTDKRKNKSIVWMCRCDCETEKEIPAYFMTGGKVKSCGCLKKKQIDNLKEIPLICLIKNLDI